MQIRNPVDFLGFVASLQLHSIRCKQQGKHKKSVMASSGSTSKLLTLDLIEQ